MTVKKTQCDLLDTEKHRENESHKETEKAMTCKMREDTVVILVQREFVINFCLLKRNLSKHLFQVVTQKCVC